MLKRAYCDSSVLRFVRDIDVFIKWAKKEKLSINQTGYNDILRFIQIKKENLKQRSVACLINSIKHYFDYKVKSKCMQMNPATFIKIKGVKRKTLYDILSFYEMEKLYFEFAGNVQKFAFQNHNRFKPSPQLAPHFGAEIQFQNYFIPLHIIPNGIIPYSIIIN